MIGLEECSPNYSARRINPRATQTTPRGYPAFAGCGLGTRWGISLFVILSEAKNH